MSFLAPAFLVAAIGAAAAVVALHFIVMRQPPEDVFPTARFIPARRAVARTVAKRPEDLLLLLVRTLAIIAIGAAFAKPEWRGRRVPVLHIVVVDRSRAVADVKETADSARRVASGASDVVVVFDSGVRVISSHAGDSLVALRATAARGAISPALVSAIRAAAEHKTQADSIELTVVSPAVRDEMDAATDSIRAVWPGAVRLIRVAARRDAVAGLAPTVRWPADGRVGDARARATVDTASAVTAGAAVIVAPFERRWGIDTTGARVIARWVDGEPAAVERAVGATGAGCVRDVAIPLPTVGDLVLRPEFKRFESVITRACGRDGADGGSEAAAWDVDAAQARHVGVRALATTNAVENPIAMWLLVGALVALVVEPALRRRGA